MAPNIMSVLGYLARWIRTKTREAGSDNTAGKIEKTRLPEKAYPGNVNRTYNARIYHNDGKLEDFLANSGLIPVMRSLDEYPYNITDYREYRY